MIGMIEFELFKCIFVAGWGCPQESENRMVGCFQEYAWRCVFCEGDCIVTCMLSSLCSLKACWLQFVHHSCVCFQDLVEYVTTFQEGTNLVEDSSLHPAQMVLAAFQPNQEHGQLAWSAVWKFLKDFHALHGSSAMNDYQHEESTYHEQTSIKFSLLSCCFTVLVSELLSCYFTVLVSEELPTPCKNVRRDIPCMHIGMIEPDDKLPSIDDWCVTVSQQQLIA